MRRSWCAVLPLLAACSAPRFEQLPRADSGAVGGASGSGGAIAIGGSSGQSGAPTGGGAGLASDASSDAAIGDAGCAHPDKCVAVPSSWSGPVWVSVGPGQRPACPSGAALIADLFDDLDPGGGSCSCSCNAANVSCVKNISVRPFTGASCSNENCVPASVNDTCKPLTSCSATSAYFTVGSPYSGKCQPSATESKIKAPTFSNQVRVCEQLAPAACSGGKTCAAAATGFESACIVKEGDHSCPAGFQRELFHESVSGQPACNASACQCGSVTGGCGTLIASTTFSCAVVASYEVPSQSAGCLSGSWVKWLPKASAQLACAPVSATVPASTAAVTATGPWTVCCAG